jgi:hypothetical protein
MPSTQVTARWIWRLAANAAGTKRWGKDITAPVAASASRETTTTRLKSRCPGSKWPSCGAGAYREGLSRNLGCRTNQTRSRRPIRADSPRNHAEVRGRRRITNRPSPMSPNPTHRCHRAVATWPPKRASSAGMPSPSTAKPERNRRPVSR